MLICEPESACRELEIPMLFDMARVLVVEDEEDIAFPLVRTLEREGYSVQWVENGVDALDQIKAEPQHGDPRPRPARHRRPRGLPLGP